MKNFNIILVIIFIVFTSKSSVFAQAPSLGTTSDFALFTTVGAITNTGISQITGHVGSNSGAGTGFGNVNGIMHSTNATTAQATADLTIAYNQLNAAIPNYFHAPLLGNGDTLVPGVYHISGVTVLNGNLILNAQGNPNAVFIFQIEAAFSSNALAKVKLINGAMACNVFWKVEGLVEIASGTYMRGTIVANNAAINFNALDTLEGRALSIAGAIAINNTMIYTPIGCGSPFLTGPTMPTLGTAACYALFTGNGGMTNAGITNVIGDVGTNVGLTIGFNPLLVTGIVHPIPDGSTIAAAADLLNAANLINIMPFDIELLYPAQFGNDLVLTPHVYLMNAATLFTGNVYLNGQGNTNAVFLIKINGTLSTSTFSNVILTNGTQAKNVYWLVAGAVDVNNYSIFNGNIISINGAVDLTTGVVLNGAAYTTNGAFSTSAIDVFSFTPCFALPVNWLYFNAQSYQQNIVIKWATDESVKNLFYTLEKSTDGIFFNEIARIDVVQNDSIGKNEYSFTDKQIKPLNYYRISQTDIDGHINYYKTIMLANSNIDLPKASHQLLGNTIEVRILGSDVGAGQIDLYSITGQKIYSKSIVHQGGNERYILNRPSIGGFYFIRVILNDHLIYQEKIILD